MARLIEASLGIVKERNNQHAHGFRVGSEDYVRCFEAHLPGVKELLSFIEPLTVNVLICPVQISRNHSGTCSYIAKVLMGSNPLFINVELQSNGVPETVCQLVSSRTIDRLSLFPFIHLDRCSECRRDMIFLFDHLERAGQGDPILREYPHNHTKSRNDLVNVITRAFGRQ